MVKVAHLERGSSGPWLVRCRQVVVLCSSASETKWLTCPEVQAGTRHGLVSVLCEDELQGVGVNRVSRMSLGGVGVNRVSMRSYGRESPHSGEGKKEGGRKGAAVIGLFKTALG